jgi:hypothetical protein
MSRSIVLLISGLYSSVVGLSMLFMPEDSLKNYGSVTVNLTEIATLQYLGVDTLAFALLAFLNRNTPNSAALRISLLVLTGAILGSFLKGLYDILVLHPPMSGLLLGDTVFRLLLGLALLYCYNRERQLARAA